jgi:hypothetical protein
MICAILLLQGWFKMAWISIVQKLGCWKNVTMVQRYAHHYPESLRAAIEMIDGVKKPIITILSQSQKNRVSMSPLKLANP